MNLGRGVPDALLDIKNTDPWFTRSGKAGLAKVLDGERICEGMIGSEEGY